MEDKKSLNANAAAFVPNIKAKEFVPSFGAKSQQPQQTQQAPQTQQQPQQTQTQPKQPQQPKETPKVDAKGKQPEKQTEKPAEKKPVQEVPEDEKINLEHEMAKLDIEMGGQKDHVNILFIGHVDAGKSTTGGQILYLTGQVDKRTLEKYEREAKEKGRESWYLSWSLDTNPEERDRGKTVEVGRGWFETETKRYTLLDAPGHKSYVPNMISGASQADIAILIISARKGEFEAGFEKQGQTREHAMLGKTAGIKKLIVAINKMDDLTVNWAYERYIEIVDKLKPFLRTVGYNLKTEVEFMPISGFTGANIKEPLTKDVCSWYSGPSLLQYLDQLEKVVRNDGASLRLPINEKYRDMGTIVGGKIEAGTLKIGQQVTIMPNHNKAEVVGIEVDEETAQFARSGDNVLLKLKGVEEEDISVGFVLCQQVDPVKVTRKFDVQLVIIDYKNIICPGYQAVMHVHSLVEEVTLTAFKHLVDKKTGKKTRQPPKFVKQGQICIATLEAQGLISLETYADYPQLGRFTLRDEGKTVAMGKVLKLIQEE